MARANEILEELRELESPLVAHSYAMPFTVPDNYFDGLPSKIIAGIGASETEDPELDLSKGMPFALPQFYFEESAAQIGSVTGTAPAITGITDVPDGYFDTLPDRVLTAVKAQQAPAKKSKTIAFAPARHIIQWAVAAMFVLGIGLGAYRMYNTPDRKAEHQLTNVDGETLNDYVDQTMDDAPVAANTVALNVPAADAVKTLSQEEITTYLDETGWDDPASTN